MNEDVYTYSWGNNPRRATLKGRRCRIVAGGRMGTLLVEFVDDGERVTTSARALRRTPVAQIGASYSDRCAPWQ